MSRSRAKKKRRRRAPAASAQAPAARDERAGQRSSAPTQTPAAPADASGAPAPTSTPAQPAPAAAARQPASRLEVRHGVPRPDAIWAPFPLTELGMAVGLVLFALGFVSSAATLFLAGVGVLGVVVAELCLREHLSGFRSHSILLGLLPVTIVHLSIVYLADATWRGPLALALDLAVAAGLAWWLQRRFVSARGRARVASR